MCSFHPCRSEQTERELNQTEEGEINRLEEIIQHRAALESVPRAGQVCHHKPPISAMGRKKKLLVMTVRVGSNTSSSRTRGLPEDVLFTLLTHDCTPSHNCFIKFADYTTVVGHISNNHETYDRSEVKHLAESLNVEKTKEIIIDFRRTHTLHTPLTISGAAVQRVSSTKFRGVHISEDLSWSKNTASWSVKPNSDCTSCSN